MATVPTIPEVPGLDENEGDVAFPDTVPEEIENEHVDQDNVAAKEVDDEQFGNNSDSDYCETDLELDEDGSDVEDETIDEKAYREECQRMDTVPVSQILNDVLKPDAKLARLDLAHHGIGDGGAFALAKALQNNETLLALIVSDNGLTGPGGAAVARMLTRHASIIEADLSENVLGNAPNFVGSAAVGALMERGKLQKLNICKNGFISREMEPIANGLRSTGSLKWLDISCNLFETEEAGTWLGTAIEENMTLTHLNISWNHMRKLGAGKVAEGVGKNSVLEVLLMGWNGFTDDGALAVAEMIGSNSTLEEIDLSNNRIGQKGSDAIATAVAGNSTLKVLRMAYNTLGDAGVVKWLETLILNESLSTLDLNYVPHSHVVNTAIHELIDRSPELDVKVKELTESRLNLEITTIAWDSLKAAAQFADDARKERDAAIAKSEWDALGGHMAKVHWAEYDHARLLGEEAFMSWKRIEEVSFRVDAMFLPAKVDAVRARVACGRAVAQTPGNREAPIAAAMNAFNNGKKTNPAYPENEIFFTVSYAGLSGVCGLTAGLFALWGEQPHVPTHVPAAAKKAAEKLAVSFAVAAEGAWDPAKDGADAPEVEFPKAEGVPCVTDELPQPVFDKKNVPGKLAGTAVEAANAAFNAAFGPAYYAATSAYVINRDKHPKDPSIATKASTQAYMDNGGNAAFDPIAEIAEMEALNRAKEGYMKEVRAGHNSDADKKDACQQAYKAYSSYGGHSKEIRMIAQALELYMEEKEFNLMVESITATVEREYNEAITRETTATMDEEKVRKANYAEDKRPDFDLTVDYGLRAGETLDSRRDPFELLHEFLDRHEIRYYEMFQRIDIEKNAFLTEAELKQGLLDMGFVCTDAQLEIILKTFFPPEDNMDGEEEEETDDFTEARKPMAANINYHTFTQRLFS